MLKLKVIFGDEEVEVEFEHSLLALSKWESKHQTPFLSSAPKEQLQLFEYFECMIVTPGVDPNIVYAIAPEDLVLLEQYLEYKPTASSVPRTQVRNNNEITTSELIYYWMVALKIPFVAESWNIHRLLMLVEIANFKQQPAKKQSTAEAVSKWKEQNAKNKARFGTDG